MPDKVLRDPGLQPERTLLAWGRTAGGMLLNTCVFFRLGWASNTSWVILVGIVLALITLLVFGWSLVRLRIHQRPCYQLSHWVQAVVATAIALCGLIPVLSWMLIN